MAKLSKSISFNVKRSDKQKLQQKAKELGIPLARMIRNIVLDKYQSLTIGYVPNGKFSLQKDIDIKRLKPPREITYSSKHEANFKACIEQLKNVFRNGINVLGKLEDSELGIKSDKELETLSRESENRMICRENIAEI